MSGDAGVVLELPSALARRDADGPRDGLVVGVDGGATKTFAVGLDLATGAVTIGRAGPANPDAIGLATAVDALAEGVAEACGGREDVRAVVIAGAGTDSATLGAATTERMPGSVFVNDVVAAWAAVANGDPAIAMIAGTGSNCLGVDARHRAIRSGGWGHVFGDEGSGWWLGREAVTAALHALDGRGPATALSGALCDALGAPDPGAAAIALYAQGTPKHDVARLAILVAECAAAGDAVATRLLRTAGEQLGGHVVAVADGLGLSAEAALPVGLTGSTWKAGGALRESFDAAVAERLPRAELRRSDDPPVLGALALALHAAGRTDAVRPLIATAAHHL